MKFEIFDMTPVTTLYNANTQLRKNPTDPIT